MYVKQPFTTWARIQAYLPTVEIFCSHPSDKSGILSHYKRKQEARKRALALNESIKALETQEEKKNDTV